MKLRFVLPAAAAGLGGYIGWQLLKPGLREAYRCDPVMTDLLRSETEGFRTVDAWGARIAPDETDDPGEWAWACINITRGTGILLVVRDAFVRAFGGITVTGEGDFLERIHGQFVRPADQDDQEERDGTSPWISLHADHEIVVGMDDKHLDFRLGLATADGQITFTTLFKVHNALGHVYWSVVRPFHRLLVQAMLRQARVPAPDAVTPGTESEVPDA
jgi:hypothetical protein